MALTFAVSRAVTHFCLSTSFDARKWKVWKEKHDCTALFGDQCMPHLCSAPITDHEVEWGGVLGVDEGTVQADGAPAGVGHLGLVPEANKFICHALDIGQILCHCGNIAHYMFM